MASVVEAARLRSRRSLLEKSLGDGVSWVQFSPNPVLSVGEVQATAGRVLVLGESHISVKDLDTWVPETGDVDASRITLRVRDVVGGALQRLVSGSTTTWELIPFEGTAGSRYQEFSLADLRAGKIGFEAGDGTNPITFTIQAEDDQGHLSDSDSVRSGYQSSSVRIPVVGLEELIGGETSSVNSDGALTPVEATLDLWRGAAGTLTILVELHHGLSGEELLLGSHGVASITSSWRWDPKREIGTLSLEGSNSASSSDFRSVLGFLQLRSAVGVSDSYRRILVRPDISGSAFRKDFHVREVKVSGNDAPEAPAAGLADQPVDEDATFTYQVPAFTDKEDDAAGKDLGYETKLVVGGSEQDLPDDAWITFDKDARTFTFKPLAIHVGSHTLRVRGTDSRGLSDYADFVVTVAEVNDAPAAPTSGLADPDDVLEDTSPTYVFDAFTDEETSTLTYTFSVVLVKDDGSKTDVSPSWITFDGTTRTFTFKPDDSSHAGKYEVTVVATDEGIGDDAVTKKSAEDAFEVVVVAANDAPKKPAAGLADPDDVLEDTSPTYVFEAFTDEEDDAAGVPLTYRAFWASKDGDGEDVVDGAGEKVFVSLPEWIAFAPKTRTFTFRPKEDSHAGVHTLRVVGEDAGIGADAGTKKRSHADFVLRVESVNDAPVASPLQDQQVDEDTIASYRFKAFTDEETPSSGLRYSAHLLVFPSESAGEVLFEGSPASEERSSGSEGSVRSRRVSSAHGSLPDWISFDGGQRLFRFSPKTGAHVGRHVLLVRGRDASGKTETADFTLHVSATNDAPEADVSIEGSLEEGRVVRLRVAGLSDEDGVPSSSMSHRYRWYESSEPEVHSSWSLIAGAEGASFRVGSGQADKYLRGVFSYTDSGGTRERVFAQSEEVVRRKSLPSVVVPIFGGEGKSSSSSVSVSEEGEALEMVSRSLSQAQERLSLMRNRRSSGSGAWSLPPLRFSFPSVLSEPRVQPPGSQGSGPQSPQAQGTTTQQSDGASSQPSSQPLCSQGSGAQVPQSPQAQGTSAQQSDGAPSQQPVLSDTPSQSGAPARQNLPVEQSADAQTQPAQGAAEDASEQIVAQDATSSSTTSVSRKTDPHSDTELRKDLGGSELPTPVRLSPHDIHTEITFISEDEVDVQLSLAEGAPMEISVRALAAQLTGDDAVRIEILDLPEGLRFDRETCMLEDTLWSGLSADGVAEVRVMLTDAQGRRMTVTLQVLSAEGLSQPEAATKLEGRTQTDDQTGSGELGGGRRDVGGSSDGAGLSDEGEGSEGSDSVGDAALEELSGDKEARSSSGSAGSGSAGALSSEGFFCELFWQGSLAFAEFVSIRLFSGSFPRIFF